MRLNCPTCDAQYEVPDEVIPAEGRDVQCSNCGNTWFQYHADHEPEQQAEVAPDPEMERVDVVPEPEPMPETRAIDPSVAEILREEAEHEQQARIADGLESQPGLGLDDIAAPEPEPSPAAVQSEREVPDHTAWEHGEEPVSTAEAAMAAAAAASRRDLLPDIEEINSTLRSAGDRQSSALPNGEGDAVPVVETQRRSFRRGFAISLVIAALLVALYVATPRIIASAPETGPTLTAYTQAVDSARLWLDTQMVRLLTWVDSAASG